MATAESVPRPSPGSGSEPFLMSGEDYRQSLRDGREVWYDGERIDDVTAHPALSGGIDVLAEMYDDQLNPETQELVTFVREDGARVSQAFRVPRSREDLRRRRACAEHFMRKTFGVFGRQMDMISTTDVGLIWLAPMLREHDPEHAENSFAYIKWAQEANVIAAAPVADPQGRRSRGTALGRRGITFTDKDESGKFYTDDAYFQEFSDGGRLWNALRVIDRTEDGIVISGAKVVGSVAPQAHELVVANLAIVDPGPDASFYCRIPVNTPGVKMLCRPRVTEPDADAWNHPLNVRGEEMDALVVYEDVFVPWWRVATMGWTGFTAQYKQFGALEWWHTLTRLAVKAELFVGVLQVVVDSIGTGHRPGVRAIVAEVIEYAEVLRGMVLAAEENASENEDGVMWPDVMKCTAGRAYAVERYPSIIHRLQELAGQGPILRYTQKDWNDPFWGPRLDWLYEGAALSAREKNLVMNFLWDLTTSGHAGRVAIFENVNGTPLPFMRERLYSEYDRTPAMDTVRRFLGLS